MAYGPLSIANPEQITDDPATYEKIRPKGDLRGLPTALVYSTKVKRPLTPVYEVMKASQLSEDLLLRAVNYVFEAVTFRPPTEKELEQYLLVTSEAIERVGKEDGVVIGLSAIFLDRDALFRSGTRGEWKAIKRWSSDVAGLGVGLGRQSCAVLY